MSNPWNVIDYDQNNSKENLIGNEESNHDLKSSVVITPDLFIDQSYGIATIHETDEREGIDKKEDQLIENDEKIATNTHQFLETMSHSFSK